MKKKLLVVMALLVGVITIAQTTVTGSIIDGNSKEPLPGVNLKIIGTSVGTSTDFDGLFTIETGESLPFSLEITYVGYDRKTVEITASTENLKITIFENQTSLDEVVLSASRTPERIFESPVTVERFDLQDIKNTASADFYDGLENIKGVDINVNSLTFKSVNTRGFSTFSNTRFVQLVDGMDNSAPALNFPIGNLLGMTETDILSVELLPGASSALYGANAFNGILFMQSKSPFEHHGISGYAKYGLTSQDAAGTNGYVDAGIRAAFKISEKFAFKINLAYLKGTDWFATDINDRFHRDITRANPDYDGTNVYGDEVRTNIRAASGGLGIVPDVFVSRTGYDERDLTDYNAESFKSDWGFYYRPWANDIEFSYVGKYASGSTIYQGTNRYSLANFFMQQHKIEVKSDSFLVRGYMTGDNAGDSYDMVFTGIHVLNKWKSHTQWFGEYINTYVGATLGGATSDAAHQIARAVAETGRFEPGTPEFKQAFDEVTNDPDLTTGSKFQDKSKVYHGEFNYNFNKLTEFADIQVGGSYRQYKLNSFGTIYTDIDGPINYSEVGFYAQFQKKFLDERFKLTFSLRYDKSQLFDGNLSPRLSLGYTLGENRDHNIRLSYQTGFRNPTTQDLFIGLNAGSSILVGSAEENLDRDVRTFPISKEGQDDGQPASATILGRAAYENSYSQVSVVKFQETGDVTDLEIANPDIVKPEEVASIELGYRGKVNILTIDFSTYYNRYKNFISNEKVEVPLYGDVGMGESVAAISRGDFETYQAYTNSDVDITSYGASIAISLKIARNYDLTANYTYIEEDYDREANPDFVTNFNTPNNKVKISFGNANAFKNFGFNVAWRWSESYLWQATFGDGIIPSYNTVDVQVNYRVPKILSTFKLGAANLLGTEYYTAFGTGHVGSQYYISWTINNL
jgi:outer membrane receptor for ferrienterochelin and colicin